MSASRIASAQLIFHRGVTIDHPGRAHARAHSGRERLAQQAAAARFHAAALGGGGFLGQGAAGGVAEALAAAAASEENATDTGEGRTTTDDGNAAAAVGVGVGAGLWGAAAAGPAEQARCEEALSRASSRALALATMAGHGAGIAAALPVLLCSRVPAPISTALRRGPGMPLAEARPAPRRASLRRRPGPPGCSTGSDRATETPGWRQMTRETPGRLAGPGSRGPGARRWRAGRGLGRRGGCWGWAGAAGAGAGADEAGRAAGRRRR